MADTNLARRSEKLPEQASQQATIAPAVDIYENGDEILLIADVPGAVKDQVSVNLDHDVLSIEARRPAEESKGLLSSEYRYADYARSFTLPSGIDGSKVQAELDNGVLRVHLTKHASLKPRKIDIKAG